MKLILSVLVLFSTFSAFASWNEVECEGKIDQKIVRVEVEQPFPNGSYFKRASLTITENGAENSFNYTVTSRMTRGFNQIRYTAGGLDLEVDFWPDQVPRWGRTYKGSLRSSELNNQYIRGLTCRFPNAN